MNKNIFGSNLEENTFNSPDKSISGSDMFRNVQEILMQSGISNGEARAEANLIITEISGFRIEEILAGALKNGFSEDIKTSTVIRSDCKHIHQLFYIGCLCH